VPSLAALPPGCPFANRCSEALDICHDTPAPWRAAAAGHHGRCHRIGE
jgi:oligopeptide/dipeptide ABC transporter ATP-binding protein